MKCVRHTFWLIGSFFEWFFTLLLKGKKKKKKKKKKVKKLKTNKEINKQTINKQTKTKQKLSYFALLNCLKLPSPVK